MSALQLAKERLHLEAGIDFQKSPGFIPHLRERILACAPCVGLLCIARHLAQTHIFARCSLAHVSLGRCRCYGYILFHDQLEKKEDLLIGNHLRRGLAGKIRPSTPRNTLSPILFLFVVAVISKCRQTPGTFWSKPVSFPLRTPREPRSQADHGGNGLQLLHWGII